jgi:hypothetical protein
MRENSVTTDLPEKYGPLYKPHLHLMRFGAHEWLPPESDSLPLTGWRETGHARSNIDETVSENEGSDGVTRKEVRLRRTV